MILREYIFQNKLQNKRVGRLKRFQFDQLPEIWPNAKTEDILQWLGTFHYPHKMKDIISVFRGSTYSVANFK